MIKALASLLLSFLTLITFALVLPLFVLPPIAAWLGWSFYRQGARNGACVSLPGKLTHLLPLLAAIASFAWGMWMMATQYNA